MYIEQKEYTRPFGEEFAAPMETMVQSKLDLIIISPPKLLEVPSELCYIHKEFMHKIVDKNEFDYS